MSPIGATHFLYNVIKVEWDALVFDPGEIIGTDATIIAADVAVSIEILGNVTDRSGLIEASPCRREKDTKSSKPLQQRLGTRFKMIYRPAQQRRPRRWP